VLPKLALAACAALCGCAALPKQRLYAPELGGVVTDSDLPATGLRVRLISPDTGEIQLAVTDAQGRFRVGPLTDYQYTVMQVGPAAHRYELQFVSAERTIRAYTDAGTGPAPSRLELVCNLSARGRPPGAQVCAPRAP
jgi:hypothetical protein